MQIRYFIDKIHKYYYIIFLNIFNIFAHSPTFCPNNQPITFQNTFSFLQPKNAAISYRNRGIYSFLSFFYSILLYMRSISGRL